MTTYLLNCQKMAPKLVIWSTIFAVLLAALIVWWFWPSIRSWASQQREPFVNFLRELQEHTNEHYDSKPIGGDDTINSSRSTVVTDGRSVDSVQHVVPGINYRSGSYTSEPVNTRELVYQFRAQPENVNKYFFEEQCRQIFEQLFPGYRFPKRRPSWLVNPKTNRPLELDGYNEELHLAFEYNGPQHYHYPNRYHRSEQEWLEQKYRDLLKRQLCNQHGVYLLTIPYHVPRHHLRSFIQRYLACYRRLVG